MVKYSRKTEEYIGNGNNNSIYKEEEYLNSNYLSNLIDAQWCESALDNIEIDNDMNERIIKVLSGQKSYQIVCW